MAKTYLTVLAAAMCTITVAHADNTTDFAECPRDVLRQAILEGVPEEETPEVLAVESMVLSECGRRQAAFTALVENDRKLQELRNQPPFGEQPQEKEEGLVSTTKTASDPEPWTGLFSEDNPYFAEDLASEGSADPARATEAEAEEPTYRYFSVYGLEGERKVGITDGSRNWHLAVGGTLPSGEVVTAISAEPELVQIKKGQSKESLTKGKAAGGSNDVAER